MFERRHRHSPASHDVQLVRGVGVCVHQSSPQAASVDPRPRAGVQKRQRLQGLQQEEEPDQNMIDWPNNTILLHTAYKADTKTQILPAFATGSSSSPMTANALAATTSPVTTVTIRIQLYPTKSLLREVLSVVWCSVQTKSSPWPCTPPEPRSERCSRRWQQSCTKWKL